jgi:hypothetical protein
MSMNRPTRTQARSTHARITGAESDRNALSALKYGRLQLRLTDRVVAYGRHGTSY